MQLIHKLQLNSLIFLFVIVGGLIVPDFQVGGIINSQQIFELLIFIPWIISLFDLTKHLKNTTNKEYITWLLSLYGLGYGLHLVANQLNNPLLGQNTQIAYFYDEILSHYIIWGCYLGILILMMKDLGNERSFKFSLTTYITAIIHGIFMAIGCIEGQSEGILALFLITVIFEYIRKNQTIRTYTIPNYILFVAIFSLITLFVWAVAFYGFPEPSEIGLIG